MYMQRILQFKTFLETITPLTLSFILICLSVVIALLNNFPVFNVSMGLFRNYLVYFLLVTHNNRHNYIHISQYITTSPDKMTEKITSTFKYFIENWVTNKFSNFYALLHTYFSLMMLLLNLVKNHFSKKEFSFISDISYILLFGYLMNFRIQMEPDPSKPNFLQFDILILFTLSLLKLLGIVLNILKSSGINLDKYIEKKYEFLLGTETSIFLINHLSYVLIAFSLFKK